MLRNEASQVKQTILIRRSFVPQDDNHSKQDTTHEPFTFVITINICTFKSEQTIQLKKTHTQ